MTDDIFEEAIEHLLQERSSGLRKIAVERLEQAARLQTPENQGVVKALVGVGYAILAHSTTKG